MQKKSTSFCDMAFTGCSPGHLCTPGFMMFYSRSVHHQQYFFSGLNFGICNHCNPYRIVLCACMMEMECDVMRCNVMYCHVMSCNVPSCTVLYCTVLYGSVWQCVVLYGTACVLLLISYCIHVAVRHVASCCVVLCSYMVCCVI